MDGQCEVSVLDQPGQKSSQKRLPRGPGGTVWARFGLTKLPLPSGLITMYFPPHTVTLVTVYVLKAVFGECIVRPGESFSSRAGCVVLPHLLS